VRSTTELPGAFQAAAGAGFDSIYVVSSRLMVASTSSFIDFAARGRVPLAGGWGAWAKAGALLSYGPNLDAMLARTATYVDSILKGASPAEMPIERPTKFELVVNVKTARSLGISVSEPFLARADEVIE
jgi:putative tryptophan/tyrosine transport system substrate-binding protein